MSLIQILLGGGALYALYSSGMKQLDKITWQLQKVRLQDVKLLKGGFEIRIDVQNNTKLPIKLLGYSGFVKRGGQVVGTVNSQRAIELPANGATTIPAFVRFEEGILDQIQALLDGGGKGALSQPIVLDSYLKTSLIDIPVRSTFEFLKVS